MHENDALSNIVKIIDNADEQVYELLASPEQNLTFDYASKLFSDNDLKFSDDQKKALRLMDDDGVYSNLGLLLSDQCPFTVKFATFSHDPISGSEIFLSKAIASGSVLSQLDFGEKWLITNNTEWTKKGMKRLAGHKFPSNPVLEALANAIVHRDYSLSGPSIVNMFEDKLEVISIGGLVSGMNHQDMLNGISRPRNPYLAEIFAKLRMVTSCGAGIRNIMKEYTGNEHQPEFNIAPHSFRAVLPAIDAETVNSGSMIG